MSIPVTISFITFNILISILNPNPFSISLAVVATVVGIKLIKNQIEYRKE